MALPFFGRKPASAAPGAQRDARPGVEARAAQDDRPPPTELSALDFTGTDHGRALARVAGQVEVRECGSGIGAAFEEAAVLYANGSDDDALAVLEAAVGSEGGEGAWLMLLDLYRLRGERQRFESRVLDYATRFERSPPPWEDLSGMAGKAAEMVTLLGDQGIVRRFRVDRELEAPDGVGGLDTLAFVGTPRLPNRDYVLRVTTPRFSIGRGVTSSSPKRTRPGSPTLAFSAARTCSRSKSFAIR